MSFPEKQEGYYTNADDKFHIFSAPKTISDPEFLGMIYEALCAESYRRVYPAYYDTAMSLRFMQDPESREMLDMMFEVLAFDYSYYIDLGGVRQGLRAILHTSNPNVVSNMKVWSKQAKIELNKQTRALEKLDQ